MPSKTHIWAYSLPTALLLMAPFDLLASLAMDIYLPVVPAMPRLLGTSPATIQPIVPHTRMRGNWRSWSAMWWKASELVSPSVGM